MRRPQLRTLLSALLVLSLLGGCGSSGPSGVADGGVKPDAGGGRDGGVEPDAGPVVGACGLRLMNISTPVEGAFVAFQDRDGEVIATVPTDANGDATYARCAADSMLTFADPRADAQRLITFTGVMPQQTIVFGNPTAPPLSVTIHTDAASAPAGVTSYGFALGCTGTTGPQATVTLLRETGCPDRDPGVISVLARAFDAGGSLLGFASVQDAPAEAPSVEVQAGPWVGVGSHTLNITHLPTAGVTTQMLMFGLWLNGTRQHRMLAVRDASDVSSSGQLVSSRPLGDVAEGYYVGASVSAGFAKSQAMVMIEGPVPESTELDHASVALPSISSAGMRVEDPTRPVAAAIAGDMSRADGGDAVVRWTQDGIVRGWQIVFPGGQTSIRYPALPAELASAGPGHDSVFEHLSKTHFQYWRAEGISYAEVIERGLSRADEAGAREHATATASSEYSPD